MTTQTDIFRRLVRAHMSEAPIRLEPTATLDDLVRRMTEAGASSAVVVDGRGQPRGIVTEQDVVRRITFRAEPTARVESVMTTPVVSVEANDYLFHAIAFMRRQGLRHIPVVDEHDAVTGMLNLHEALAMLSGQTMELIDALTHEETIAGLTNVKQAQVRLAEALFADGVPVPEVQALLTEINRDIHRRVVRRELQSMLDSGWGEPPVPFALIIMGSGGRGENFLYPDQDNGFVLGDYDDAESAQIDAFFLELADRMTQTLDKVGFPLCKGNVMATNPVWRKKLSQWREQIDFWLLRRSPAMLLSCDIFFDFCHVYGESDFSHELRNYVTDMVPRHIGFLSDMFRAEADHKVALGWFGRLRTQKGEDGVRRVDLKLGATLPLVEGARLLALKHKIPNTSTLERLRALGEKDVLPPHLLDYLIGGFHHITMLLLRQQIADFNAGRKVGNLVPLTALSKREKEYLVACLRAIDDLRGRLRLEFAGEVL